MYRIKISENFLLILNNEDQSEFARHPLKDCDYEQFDDLTVNPLYRFTGIIKQFGTKDTSKTEFRFNELLDDGGIAFTSISALNTLLDENLGKSSGGSSSIPTSDVFYGGFVDYNDLATTTTPIAFVTDTPIVLTNDKLGVFTNESYLPVGVTSIFSLNQFDWSQLKLGDMVDIRLDIAVTTNSPNQEVKVDLALGVGANEYLIPFEDISEKSTGLHQINRFNGIYIGDANTLNNPAEFRLQSDGTGTVIVNGWYCKIIRKGI